LKKQRISDRLSKEARALPQRSHGWFRTWFRKIWDVRGGGLYACGFAVTFIILEVGSIGEDIGNIGQVFDGELIAFAVNFFIDSFKNTGMSFAWPVYVVRISPPMGAIGLGLAFWLFPVFLKKPIENWLFDGESPTVEATDKGNAK
tara:strand:- start:98 stop:535 length:438 start_codon:yes stop_codon:yes gene_type:complete